MAKATHNNPLYIREVLLDHDEDSVSVVYLENEEDDTYKWRVEVNATGEIIAQKFGADGSHDEVKRFQI